MQQSASSISAKQQPASSAALTRRFSLRRVAAFLFLLGALFLAYQLLSASIHQSVVNFTAIYRRPLVRLPSWFGHSETLPNYRAPGGTSCRALFANDKREHERAQTYMLKHYKGRLEPESYFQNLKCAEFVAQRRYITYVTSDEEKNFPIAYSIVVFKDLGQIERLFRAIYRPQNAYCFHVDKKSTAGFREGLKRLASCFSHNVFLSSRTVDVAWASWTVLDADLICMKELLTRHKKWKYLINLTGQEFPLKTNLELVRILTAFNGSNSMEGTVKHINKGRAPSKTPYNIKWTKGSVHIVAKRAFFEFLFTDRKVMNIIQLLRPMPFVDETLFATLNHNPQLGTPGAYLGEPETGLNYPFMPRYKNWGHLPCHSGKWVRQICIWGVKDLPQINPRPELFINKLYWDFQPLALDCLEERLWNHTRRDYGDTNATTDPTINIDFYRNLSFVKLHQ